MTEQRDQSGGRSRPPSDSELLAALFAGAPIGLGCWDSDLRFRRINAVLAAMNGLPVEEHLGRTIAEVLPDLWPELQAVFMEVLSTGRPKLDMQITGETPAAPGVERHWLASYFPVLDDQGHPVGIGASVLEATAEREATARAGRAEQLSSAMDAHLRAVYSALPLGVGFVAPDLRFERVNDALARMDGRSVEEHLGRTVAEVLGDRAPQADEAIREVIRRRQPLEVEFALRSPPPRRDERFFEATYFPVFSSRSEVSSDRLLGVGAVVRDVTERHMQEREREQLLRDAVTARAQAEAAQVRAEAARQATEAALVEAEAQRAAAEAANRRATFLAAVTRRLAASLDYEATVQEIVSSAIPYLADWGFVTVLEPDGRPRVLGASHFAPEHVSAVSEFAERYADDAGSSVRVAIHSREPVVATDVDARRLQGFATDGEGLELVHRLGLRHIATWPIQDPEGAVIGALSFVLGSSGRSFTDSDRDVMAAVATRAGLHLTNAQLYAERAEIADTLQAGLMPAELPQIPGLDVAAAFVAAGRHIIIGGDFYDVFASGEGVWTAIIGDVVGKGAKAAAVTATARHTLRAAAMLDQDPTHNLALLNRVMQPPGRGADFCSVIYARLCPGPSRLAVQIAHAGHPPALILRDDGRVEQVSGGRGPLVGIAPDARFEASDLSLRSNEVLLLYTDGVTEARRGNIALGEQELASTLCRAQGRPARDVAEQVKDCALRLQSGSPRDDIAVLAIRVLPPRS